MDADGLQSTNQDLFDISHTDSNELENERIISKLGILVKEFQDS